MQESDAITAVQTLRNAIMVVALMSQAAAYIGARALPDVLLSSDYRTRLAELAVRRLLSIAQMSLSEIYLTSVSLSHVESIMACLQGWQALSSLLSAPEMQLSLIDCYSA